MSKNDQQFSGYAYAVLNRMLAENKAHIHGEMLDLGSEEAQQSMHRILAQAAYDLVQHTIGHSLEYLHECGISTSGGMGKRIVPSIPDMVGLPEEQAE